MQKSWRLVFFTSFGLILGLLPSSAFSDVIWESLGKKTPSIFKGYNKTFIVSHAPKGSEAEKLIKDIIGSRGDLVTVLDHEQQFEAMRLSHLSLYISYIPIEGKGLNILTLSAKAATTTDISDVDFLSTIWEKCFILEGTSESAFKQKVSQSLSSFFSQYFKDNPQGKEKPKFYLFES